MEKAIAAAGRGMLISQRLAGAGMYLRSMIGPEGWLYAFYDQPELVHDCMQTWLTLADTVIARHQQHVTIDEIFFAEDVCYNHGPLIGHDTFKEFVFPYYQQLLANLKRRQLDQSRHLYVQIDTDGDCRPTIGWFAQALAMDVMSPFEVASGCDVVAIALEHPNLVMRGGIDKRVLAQGRRAIDEMVERIIPLMRQRGGYIPCCDHSVPNEVPYADYLYYRQRCVELGG
jgi:uroporphyrinogen decarboxylase